MLVSRAASSSGSISPSSHKLLHIALHKFFKAARLKISVPRADLFIEVLVRVHAIPGVSSGAMNRPMILGLRLWLELKKISSAQLAASGTDGALAYVGGSFRRSRAAVLR